MDTLQMLGLMVVAIVAAAAANVYLARQKRPQKWVQWGIVTFGGIGATALLCWAGAIGWYHPAVAQGVVMAMVVAGGVLLFVRGPALLGRVSRSGSTTAKYASYTRRVQP